MIKNIIDELDKRKVVHCEVDPGLAISQVFEKHGFRKVTEDDNTTMRNLLGEKSKYIRYHPQSKK
jgi:hypothetical protein